MGFIKFITEGSWWIRSKKDPRWNFHVTDTQVGMGMMPPEAEEKLRQLDQKFGDRPDDLEWGYHKY